MTKLTVAFRNFANATINEVCTSKDLFIKIFVEISGVEKDRAIAVPIPMPTNEHEHACKCSNRQSPSKILSPLVSQCAVET